MKKRKVEPHAEAYAQRMAEWHLNNRVRLRRRKRKLLITSILFVVVAILIWIYA